MSAPNMGQMGGYNQLLQQAPQQGNPQSYLAMLQQGAQGQGMGPNAQQPPRPPQQGPQGLTQRLGGAGMAAMGNPPGSPTNGMGQPGGMGMRPSPQAQAGTPQAQSAMSNPFVQALAAWHARQQGQGQPGQMGQRPPMPQGGQPQWGPNPMGAQMQQGATPAPFGPPAQPQQQPQWGPPVNMQKPPGM